MSSLIKNSAWSLLAQSGKIVTQAGLFILLARGFGVHDFGLYMAIFSISQLIYPFSGFGTHNTLVMRVSRCPKILPFYFWTPLVSTLLIGFTASFLIGALTSFIYTVSFYVVLFILITELVAYRLIDVATHVWQAKEKLRSGSMAYLSISFARLVMVLVLSLAESMTIYAWSLCNLLLTFAVAIVFLWKVIREYEIPVKKIRLYPREVLRGIYFSFSGTSQAINANIDKIVLSRLGSLNDVGVYAAAYRIVQMGLLPLMAVLQATYPLYFRAGSNGLAEALSFSRKIMIPMVAYGVVASCAIVCLAPLIPFILGAQYTESVYYMQCMSPLPILQVAHYLLGEAMTGAGLQKYRALIQIGVGLISIVLNIVLITWFGIMGAIATVLSGEILLFVGYVVVIKSHSRSA